MLECLQVAERVHHSALRLPHSIVQLQIPFLRVHYSNLQVQIPFLRVHYSNSQVQIPLTSLQIPLLGVHYSNSHLQIPLLRVQIRILRLQTRMQGVKMSMLGARWWRNACGMWCCSSPGRKHADEKPRAARPAVNDRAEMTKPAGAGWCAGTFLTSSYLRIFVVPSSPKPPCLRASVVFVNFSNLRPFVSSW
jgi:3-dehydroquinate dehydratase